MNRNWMLLNLVLCITASLLAFQLRKQWQTFYASHNAARIQPQSAQPTQYPGAVSKLLTPPNYSAIVDKHLFNLERNNVVPVDPPPPSEPKVVAPKPILMGTMGLAGSTYALMVSGAGGDSKLYRRLRVGEQLDGYTLVKVLHDKVVMSAEGTELDVRIADQPKPRSQAAPDVTASGTGNRVSAVGTSGNPNPAQVDSPQTPAPDAPDGTVFNGRRKRIVASPFGPTIVWEDVK
jgi:hypothetical protein